MSVTTYIKAACWTGAATDAFFAIGMVFPGMLQAALHMAPAEVGIETRTALGLGAALMSGWTLLLVWAGFEPIARKGVLVLTIVPVIAGLALSTLFGFLNGYIPWSGALSVWVGQAVLVLLFGTGYVLASRKSRNMA